MIFIAITGGFFMENVRESIVEHHKEKEYIISMVRDIEDDTAAIQRIIKNNQNQMKGIDSLLCLLEDSTSKFDLNKFYNFTFEYLNHYTGMSPRDITISQLKNSGGLRLIKNKSVADSIVIYYSAFESNREQENYNTKFLEDILMLEMEFMDFSPYRVGNRELKLNDKTKLKVFYNRALMFNNVLLVDENIRLKTFYQQGSSLLKYLREEYKITH